MSHHSQLLYKVENLSVCVDCFATHVQTIWFVTTTGKSIIQTNLGEETASIEYIAASTVSFLKAAMSAENTSFCRY